MTTDQQPPAQERKPRKERVFWIVLTLGAALGGFISGFVYDLVRHMGLVP